MGKIVDTLNWGAPSELQIGKLSADGTVDNWIDIDTPVEDSVQLEPTEGELKEARGEGELKEARGEGGVIVSVKKKKNTYKFSFELFKKKGVAFPVADVDGVIDGFYAMRLVPEDPTTEGIQFSKSVMSVTETFNTADGQRKKYVMNVINETDGTSTIKPYTKASE